RSFIKPFGAGFRVTDKVIRQGRLALNRRVALPFIILLLLHVIGLAFALLTQKQIDEPEAFLIVSYFAVSNIALLWVCTLVSIDVAQRHAFVRFPRQLPCIVTWEDTGIAAETISISEGDVVLKMNSVTCNIPRKAFAHFPEIDLSDIPMN